MLKANPMLMMIQNGLPKKKKAMPMMKEGSMAEEKGESKAFEKKEVKSGKDKKPFGR